MDNSCSASLPQSKSKNKMESNRVSTIRGSCGSGVKLRYFAGLLP